ncbi:beta-glucuronidase [Vibrio metoecus]|nr:beta-glucuronidase [Vibrio metoecus]
MSVFMYPLNNEKRRVISLDGIWKFKFDTQGVGRLENWKNGLTDTIEMVVPSSYNDIFTEAAKRDFCGDVWYQTEFYIPTEFAALDTMIRFGSATHRATVYVNGVELVSHEGGYTPFAANLNEVAKFGQKNTVVVVVNNELSKVTIPVGSVKVHDNGVKECTPAFDFFNYAGIHSSVRLIAVPKTRINDITVVTSFEGTTGEVKYTIESDLKVGQELNVSLLNAEGEVVATATGLEGTLTIDNVVLWQPRKGYLYDLVASIVEGEELVDIYTLPVGVRTVKVEGSRFLINNEPFYFKGFGHHIDAHTIGRGHSDIMNLRDLECLDWINANSLRTSHYPYPEEFMQLADRRGLVIIDEVSHVGAWNMTDVSQAGMGGTNAVPVKHFDREDVQTEGMANHKDAITKLIARDKNHPCVVMWSLSNEPDSSQDAAEAYFKEIFEFARNGLDAQQRPMTMVNFMLAAYGNCKASQFADVVCLNRYYGWYVTNGADLPNAGAQFAKELAGWATEGKPIIITEFGADTVSGFHALPSTMFTEEYYNEYLDQNFVAFDGCEAVVGEHCWNMHDFNTAQGIIRVNGNKKGVFTRDRQPKMAAHHLRARWAEVKDFNQK